MKPNRFDPYDSEIRGCWCALCMTLASAYNRGGAHALTAASDALFAALEAGTHRKSGPKVSLSKERCIRPTGRSFMQTGMGLGVTLGGVTGAIREA